MYKYSRLLQGDMLVTQDLAVDVKRSFCNQHCDGSYLIFFLHNFFLSSSLFYFLYIRVYLADRALYCLREIFQYCLIVASLYILAVQVFHWKLQPIVGVRKVDNRMQKQIIPIILSSIKYVY